MPTAEFPDGVLDVVGGVRRIQSLRAFRRAAFIVAGVGSDPSAGRLDGEFTDQLFTKPSCIEGSL